MILNREVGAKIDFAQNPKDFNTPVAQLMNCNLISADFQSSKVNSQNQMIIGEIEKDCNLKMDREDHNITQNQNLNGSHSGNTAATSQNFGDELFGVEINQNLKFGKRFFKTNSMN